MAVMGRSQGARAATRARNDLLRGAAGAGWELEESVRDDVAYPAHLAMHLVTPAQRLRTVTGDGFEASTWRCKRRSGGRARLVPVTLQLLRHPAPVVDLELFFGRMPDGRNPIIMPDAFRDRVALLPEARVMAGGDIEKVLAELEPLLGRIAGPGLALVAWPGEINLISLDQPDTAALTEWVALASEIEAALS